MEAALPSDDARDDVTAAGREFYRDITYSLPFGKFYVRSRAQLGHCQTCRGIFGESKNLAYFSVFYD